MNSIRNSAQRLIIVSNRLPFSITIEEGTPQFRPSAGGLVTGMSSFLDMLAQLDGVPREYVWVGWPGESIDFALQDRVRTESRVGFHSHPVFLTQEEMDAFYFGFCNKTIWPLFHYFPSFTVYQENLWEQYRHVNEVFCEGVLEVVAAHDIVWVHDYHLMLLPHLLKQKAPHLQVGFFLHIPFPSFEIFRLLPGKWRVEILEGLLGSDLIGFHTYEYSQHFLQCVLRLLGHEHNMGQILTPERVVKVETFPMGIDYEKFARDSQSPRTDTEVERLLATLGDVKVILSVDRLDYTKGILNRLEGFEILLGSNPPYHGKVVLIMIVVPSRIGVDQYDLMKRQIEELVGKINGKYGHVGWTPVVYQYRHVAFESLIALYRISHVALVTPLRDGMNLVAKEYVAAQTHEAGVLVLSEMAGAAKELGEAIIINPNNREEIADALKQALELPADEQKRRTRTMQDRLRRYSVTRWAEDFVRELSATEHAQEQYTAKLLSLSEKHDILEHYQKSSRRLLLLDYDGTLISFAQHPSLAKPTDEIIGLLEGFAHDPRNTVVIVSGRDKETLQQWFGDLPIEFAAEHGTWLRDLQGEWRITRQQTDVWKQHIRPILQLYADRLPGAMVEEKDYALAWHYRVSDPEQGQALARELTDHLVTFTANIDIQVIQGNKVIEVRTAGVTKGTASQHFLSKREYDFVLAIGDDSTDEDIFSVMPDSAYSIKVGIANTRARFNIKSPREVIRLLGTLCKSTSGIQAEER